MGIRDNTKAIKKLDRKLRKKEAAFKPKLETRYDALGAEAKKQVKGLVSGYRKEIKVSRKKTNKDLTGRLRKDLEKYFSDIEKESKKSVRSELMKHAKTKEQKLKVANIRADKNKAANKKWAAQLARKQTKDFEDYINKSIKDAKAMAKEEGRKLSQREIKDLIDDKTQSFINTRLDNTVENEANRIQNQVRAEAYQESGLVQGVVFTAVLDNSTTENCRSKNGTKIALDDPKLQAYLIPQHPRCRSCHVPILITDRVKFTPAPIVTLRGRDKDLPKPPAQQPKYFAYEDIIFYDFGDLAA